MTGNIPLVTVSMPYFGCPQTVRRAVDSVLNQTMGDLRLVVIDDGGELPSWCLGDIADPRLVVFRLDENSGRYFADAVALHATQSEWFAVCDADDEVDPRWLERMLDAATGIRPNKDYVSTAQRVEGASGVFATEKVKTSMPRATLTHYAHMGGLWRTKWLRDVAGGMHPDFRVGYDTLLSMIARSWGDGRNLDEALYTRYRRAGSLTTARETGMRSRHRAEARVHLTRLWRRIREIDPKSAMTPRDVLRTEGRQTWARVDAYAATLLREHGFGPDRRPVGDDRIDAARYAVATALGTKPVCSGYCSEIPSGVTEHDPRCSEFRADDPPPTPERHAGMPWTTVAARWDTPWVLGQATAAELDRYLTWKRPARIVEFGSGVSTLVLAAHAKAYGGEVTAFEHDERYFARTESMLKDVGLWRPDLVRHAPLAQGANGPLYSGEIPFGVDFALIDGPPEGLGGRAEVVHLAHNILHPAGRAWLDDAERPGERAAIAGWKALVFGREDSVRVHTWGGRKVAELLLDESEPAWSTPLQGTVVVTILAGGRPSLLKRTLDGIRPLLPMSQISWVVVLNQPDDASRAACAYLIDELGERVTVQSPAAGVMSIGEGVARCARAAADSGAEYWLHLEDDWLVDTADDLWLHRAIEVLRRRLGTTQVRLRHTGERILPYHMLTRWNIAWRADEALGALVAAEAHWTFNPSLVRTADVAPLLAGDLRGERLAQEIMHNSGRRGVAQLYPGVFRHLGGGDSLADRTGGR